MGSEVVWEGRVDRAFAVGLRCAHFGTRKMPSNVPAWRARLLLLCGSAAWLQKTSASLGEDIFNITFNNIACVLLDEMLLALLLALLPALLPSFALVWIGDLSAAATVKLWRVQATGAHRLLYGSVHCADACHGAWVVLCRQSDSFLFHLSKSWVHEIPYQVQSQRRVSTV